MTKIKRIFVDVDEVLADFRGAAARVWGVTMEELMPHWPEGHWSIVEPLGAALGRDLTVEEFWNPIDDEGMSFWSTLKPLPWCQELIELVDSVGVPIHYISSPGGSNYGCYSGKASWLDNVEGSNQFLHITEHKHVCSQPGHLLIDDKQSNVDDWRDVEGEAILFPTHGNTRHLYKDNPLDHVRMRLEELRCI